MSDRLIVATEALASGLVTRRELRRRYTKVHRNVYAVSDADLDAAERAFGAWLWSGRRATLVGHSAAAWLGDRWVPSNAPVELVHSRRGSPKGITIRSSRFRTDEVCEVRGVTCTTPARTAHDLGRRLPVTMGVIRIDMLLNATRTPVSAVTEVADRYPGARGIPVCDAYGRVRRRIDMGWRQWNVGVEYDGAQHFTDATGYADDIDRLEFLAEQGWTIVRVSARQLRYERPVIVTRVGRALERAGM